MGHTIQKDIKQLQATTDRLDDEQTKLDKQKKTGEAVYAASSFDFFRTLCFLAVSVVVYFSLLPFIFWSAIW